ncbi:energy transducer TonB [Notoacmeibacter marinus]|uniref:energy transducer TonB n=1 Tax=Notoacmeibacter marinus TaxID=1876515 RepID=UPI001FE1841B|nr:energy transducer TonB [Notoacmeibacter marinus]
MMSVSLGRLGLGGALAASVLLHLALFFAAPASSPPESEPSVATIQTADALFAPAPSGEALDPDGNEAAADDSAEAPEAVPVETKPAQALETEPAEPVMAEADTLLPQSDDAPDAAPVETLAAVEPADVQPAIASEAVSQTVVAEDLGELVEMPLPITRPNDAAAQEAARQAIARADQQRAAERRTAERARQRAAENRQAQTTRKTDARKASTAKAEPRQTRRAASQRTTERRGQGNRSQQASTQRASRNSAAVRRYPGRVRSRIASRVTGGARGTVHVTFTVGRGGGLNGARISRSSGSSAADRAALNAVRRAAPFPPIPSEAGRSSWSFTVPIKVR